MFRARFSLILVALIAGCASTGYEGVYKTYYESGELKSVQNFKHGVLHGISREYYESGTLEHAIEYKNDEIDGMYNTYYPSGALWVNEFYKQGNVTGRREYDEDGRLIKEEGYGW